jgi:hypothetical protein
MKKKAEYESKLAISLTPRSFSEQIMLPQEQNLNKNYYAGSTWMKSEMRSAPQTAVTEETASPFGGLVFSANVIGEFELRAK